MLLEKTFQVEIWNFFLKYAYIMIFIASASFSFSLIYFIMYAVQYLATRFKSNSLGGVRTISLQNSVGTSVFPKKFFISLR